MQEFLKKNTEFIDTFKRKTAIFKGELTYYHFKIRDKHYMLSINEETKTCVLTDYIEENENISKVFVMGSKNNIKEAIKKLIVKSEVN